MAELIRRRSRDLGDLRSMQGVACGCGAAVSRLNTQITEMVRLATEGIDDRGVWNFALEHAEEDMADVEDSCGVNLGERPFDTRHRLGALRRQVEEGRLPIDEWNILMAMPNLSTGLEYCEATRGPEERMPR